MFSSRNIHFAILGTILGASTGYIVAFYKASTSVQAAAAVSDAMPSGHPELSNTQMIEELRKAAEENPNSIDIVRRYAVALFEADRFAEAEQWLGKAVDLAPTDLFIRSMYGVVLWESGKKENAQAVLEATLKLDPGHIPSLHGLLLLAVEKREEARARQLLAQIEKLEPNYQGLPAIRNSLQSEFGPGK